MGSDTGSNMMKKIRCTLFGLRSERIIITIISALHMINKVIRLMNTFRKIIRTRLIKNSSKNRLIFKHILTIKSILLKFSKSILRILNYKLIQINEIKLL